MGKWSRLDEIIDKALESGEGNYSGIAKRILNVSESAAASKEVDALRKYIKRRAKEEVTNTSATKSNEYSTPFQLSAWDEDGTIMDIDKYCEHHGLPREDITSYKLITHSKNPFYNTVFKEVGADLDSIREWNEAINSAKDEIRDYFIKTPKNNNNSNGSGTAVVKISDLHFGALTQGLKRTADFSVKILTEKLMRIPPIVNKQNFKTVHVHLHGDLIESFTGLNHINSWKGIEEGVYGANAIKLCTDVITEMLNAINGLGAVKIIGGNHDRVTSNNREDVKAEAADLIAWGLTMREFDVEFDPMVIRHIVDGICHVCLHGDKGISKKSTKDIVWDYGVQGKFNFVCEGHLHSRMQKSQAKKRLRKNRFDIR